MLKYRGAQYIKMEVHYEKKESIGITHIRHCIGRVSDFVSLRLFVYGRLAISHVESSAVMFSGIYGVDLYHSYD